MRPARSAIIQLTKHDMVTVQQSDTQDRTCPAWLARMQHTKLYETKLGNASTYKQKQPLLHKAGNIIV
eukprot:scaffold87650_cov20-Tisochrysis_lutea.AAC.1